MSKCLDSNELQEHNVCSGWSWNYTARECAQEAKKLGWERYQLEEAMMEFGFNQSNIQSVIYEFEIGE